MHKPLARPRVGNFSPPGISWTVGSSYNLLPLALLAGASGNCNSEQNLRTAELEGTFWVIKPRDNQGGTVRESNPQPLAPQPHTWARQSKDKPLLPEGKVCILCP